MMELGEIQAHALKLTARLARIRFELAALVAELYRHHLPDPQGPEWEGISEGRRAPSLAWHLAGALDAIEDDRLRPVEDDLRAAAEVTAADLEREFRQSGAGVDTEGGG